MASAEFVRVAKQMLEGAEVTLVEDDPTGGVKLSLTHHGTVVQQPWLRLYATMHEDGPVLTFAFPSDAVEELQEHWQGRTES